MTAGATARPQAAVERVELAEGWTALGVPAGSSDNRLEGLDDALLPFSAPGTAGSALRDAGLWRPGGGRSLDEEDWWFRCRFASPWEEGADVLLRLGGLATVADVWLNGEHVLASENAHVSHAFAVRLRDQNELVVGVRALAPLLAERRPRPRWRTRLVQSQNLRWFRTPLVGRLPAFAPEPALVGPWREVALERRRHVAVEELRVRTRVAGETPEVRMRARLVPLAGNEVLSASAHLDGRAGELELTPDGDAILAEGTLATPGARLWWPHTHGEPALHDLALAVETSAGTVELPCGRVGFRSLEAEDDPGLAISVNGVAVFCRGGSWLPDAVAFEPGPEEQRALLEQARDAGMNMIRLSGVGSYAGEAFLALCDELGLLVWQDFPFANLDYPIEDEGFRSAVEHEAGQFLERAGAHPGLVVLCGNSEIEQQVGMLGLDPELGRGPLFGELLPGLVEAHEVDAHYVPSSPSGGTLPFRPWSGVAHYFGVGAYRRPLEDARRAEVRFASECLAFANVPDDAMIDSLAPGSAGRLVHHPGWKAGVPRDVGTGWDFDDVRDHYLRELYDLDPVELRWADPERYLAVSRVVTGEVMAAAFGEWRRRRSTCAGALVWTLNDPVPGAGWGVFDASGRPKAAYWYLRRALAPVGVWMTDEGNNGLALHVGNDTAETIEARLDVDLFRGDGTPVEHASRPIELAPHTTLELDVETLLGRFADAGYAFRFGPAPHEVVAVTLADESAVLSQAFHFPLGRPATQQPSDDLGLDAVAEPSGEELVLELSARRLAYAVAVDVPGFRPSDDFLTIAPGAARRLRLRRDPVLARPGVQQAQPPAGVVAALNGYTPVRIRFAGEGRQ